MGSPRHEAIGRVEFVPDSVALLLVGRDPLTAPGDDSLQLEQLGPRLSQPGAALLAEVGPGVCLVVVAAGFADLEARPDHIGRSLPAVPARQGDPGHLVAGALMIDQRVRPEFTDGQEARSLEPGALRASS